MRHYKKGRKLGTDASHTRAIKKSLCLALFANDRIKTTLERAKEIRGDVDRIITWAKRGDVHSRRLAIAKLGDKDLVAEIFKKVEQGLFKGREGGYTRIIKIGTRRGDAAVIVIMELVQEPVRKKKASVPDIAEAAAAKPSRRTAAAAAAAKPAGAGAAKSSAAGAAKSSAAAGKPVAAEKAAAAKPAASADKPTAAGDKPASRPRKTAPVAAPEEKDLAKDPEPINEKKPSAKEEKAAEEAKEEAKEEAETVVEKTAEEAETDSN